MKRFKVGKRYYDATDKDNFEVIKIDRENGDIAIKYDNGTHKYVAYDGACPFSIGILEYGLNNNEIQEL